MADNVELVPDGSSPEIGLIDMRSHPGGVIRLRMQAVPTNATQTRLTGTTAGSSPQQVLDAISTNGVKQFMDGQFANGTDAVIMNHSDCMLKVRGRQKRMNVNQSDVLTSSPYGLPVMSLLSSPRSFFASRVSYAAARRSNRLSRS